MTFELLKNGQPFACLVPAKKKICRGHDLAEALAKTELPEQEAKAWCRDRRKARQNSTNGGSLKAKGSAS